MMGGFPKILWGVFLVSPKLPRKIFPQGESPEVTPGFSKRGVFTKGGFPIWGKVFKHGFPG